MKKILIFLACGVFTSCLHGIEFIHTVNSLPIRIYQYGDVAEGEIFFVGREYNNFKHKKLSQGHAIILSKDGKELFFQKSGPFLFIQKHANSQYSISAINPRKWYISDELIHWHPYFVDRQDQHDFTILENGNYLYLKQAWKIINPNYKILYNIIEESTSLGEIVFQWDTFVYFSLQDLSEQALKEFTHGNTEKKWLDFTHSNAIWVDHDKHLLLSSRSLNEITKIHREAGTIRNETGSPEKRPTPERELLLSRVC